MTNTKSMLAGYETVICILNSVLFYEGKKTPTKIIYRAAHLRILSSVKDNREETFCIQSTHILLNERLNTEVPWFVHSALILNTLLTGV